MEYKIIYPKDDVGYKDWKWLTPIKLISSDAADIQMFERYASLTISKEEKRTGAWHSMADGKPFRRIYFVPSNRESVPFFDQFAKKLFPNGSVGPTLQTRYCYIDNRVEK